jgi:hypothetical protein
MSKQSSSLSSPRKMAGDVESDELDWDKTVLGSWLCIMPCTIFDIFKTNFQKILTMEEGFYHENPSIAGVLHLQKVSSTFKRRHPLTKGVPHLYKRQTILLYIRRLHSTWGDRTGYNHNKFLYRRIVLFLYTHKLYHFIPCFVFKTCINSKIVTHISCKLSPAL